MCRKAHWHQVLQPYGRATSTDRPGLNRLSASELLTLPNPPVNRQRGFPRWRSLASTTRGDAVSRLPSLGLFSYWIFTAKMITACCTGVSRPTDPLVGPATPFAGAV